MSPTLSVHATYAGVILGTAAYMSPEQARGRAVDKRTDIWAFGCLMFEMLTGARPFGGEDVAETIGAVIHKEPAWHGLPATTPPSMRTALQRCLEKDVKQRVRDIGDVRLLMTGAFEAVGPSSAAASRSPSMSRRLLVAAGAVGLAAAAAGPLGGSSRPFRGPTSPASRCRRRENWCSPSTARPAETSRSLQTACASCITSATVR